MSKTSSKIKQHKSPINSLLETYKIEPKKSEKIMSAAKNPAEAGKLPFKINIANNGDNLVREAKNTIKEVQVYADGSAINGKVGVAAVLIRAGKPPHILHKHLGPESKHTVHVLCMDSA